MAAIYKFGIPRTRGRSPPPPAPQQTPERLERLVSTYVYKSETVRVCSERAVSGLEHNFHKYTVLSRASHEDPLSSPFFEHKQDRSARLSSHCARIDSLLFGRPAKQKTTTTTTISRGIGIPSERHTRLYCIYTHAGSSMYNNPRLQRSPHAQVISRTGPAVSTRYGCA